MMMNTSYARMKNSLSAQAPRGGKILSVIALAALTLSSCSKDQEGATLSLGAQASYSTLNAVDNGSSSTMNTGNVSITDFRLSIKEVEFEYDEDDKKASEGSYKDVKLKGPFELNLLEGGKPFHRSVGIVNLPNAAYDEVEFKIHKGKELAVSNPLYNKSVLIKGTVNSKPFVMWHDVEEEFEVSFDDDREFVVKGNKLNLALDFQIERILNAVHQIDLTQAKDGNNDGVIEISPYDKDGNNALAKLLKENIKEAADLKD